MSKSTRKKTKSEKKTQKPAKNPLGTVECVSSLQELHKLQGALLAQLKKQIS